MYDSDTVLYVALSHIMTTHYCHVRALQLSLNINNVHIPLEQQLCAPPVNDVCRRSCPPSEHVLDRAVWEDRVPHIHVQDLTNETLLLVKVTHIIVWILSEDNLAPSSDGVALLVYFGQALPPVHEEGHSA